MEGQQILGVKILWGLTQPILAGAWAKLGNKSKGKISTWLPPAALDEENTTTVGSTIRAYKIKRHDNWQWAVQTFIVYCYLLIICLEILQYNYSIHHNI